MVTLCAIAAMDKNKAIGKKGDIPWRLRNDFKFFQQVTLGHPVIMGRKTWESLPKRPLRDRDNIVITSNRDILLEKDKAYCVTSDYKEALDIASCQSNNIFVIGGESIYNLYKPLINTMLITHVDAEIEGADTFFPIDLPERYIPLNCFEQSEVDEYNFEIRKYEL